MSEQKAADTHHPIHPLLAERWSPYAFADRPVAASDLRSLFEAAPVLALGIASLHFERNGKPNRAAVHDLGLAAGNLSIEATARGLAVHQMIGIDPDRARTVYAIPDGYEAWTGWAIGHRGEPEQLPESHRGRDLAPRQRKPLAEIVFSERFGEPAHFLRRPAD